MREKRRDREGEREGRKREREERERERERAHPVDVLKTLPQMRLHSSRVFGLREDLQQLIVRKEVEARKGRPLGLQILTESLLNLLQ